MSELFQQADALWKLFSELNFGLDKDTSIENNFHIFGKLYYCYIFKCIQFHLAYNPFQAHIDFDLVHLADTASYWNYSEMYIGDRWRDSQDYLLAAAKIVPVICASEKTHLTNFSGDQHS
jgi:hypothetical protein